MFSQALSEQGYIVQDFRWNSLLRAKTSFIFVHWPDEFFTRTDSLRGVRSLIKLLVLHVAKMLWGTKFVWVAHNAMPHDSDNVNSLSKRGFLRSLDGVVFLSEHSRKLIQDLYPAIRPCDSLVTVHPHYRSSSISHETPCANVIGDIKLLHFGQIRPYKNVETLVDVVSSVPFGVHLSVAGMIANETLCETIKSKVQRLSHITLDLRDVPIEEAELEMIVDSSDAVVLPYKNILNSAAALFSLSRNRPILAPNTGSLPELQETVGRDWVYLYDNEFSVEVLREFREWMLTTKRAKTAPMDAYNLRRIGEDLRGLIEAMKGKGRRWIVSAPGPVSAP
jgi:glycosyltransferase involved in cell wall biosynthesis